MSRKKGMSRDDKLTAMQELMIESADIWTLKDLERDCPKKKGIVAQTVKDVLQELCDNDLVSSDRIGSGNFYWCFPSEALSRRQVQISKLEEEIADYKRSTKELRAEIKQAEVGREESAERDALNDEIAALEAKLNQSKEAIAKYDRMNPVALKQMQIQSVTAMEAANRWTENVMTLRSWANRTFALNPQRFNESFTIAEDFDYLE
jgi:hypothetical protein